MPAPGNVDGSSASATPGIFSEPLPPFPVPVPLTPLTPLSSPRKHAPFQMRLHRHCEDEFSLRTPFGHSPQAAFDVISSASSRAS